MNLPNLLQEILESKMGIPILFLLVANIVIITGSTDSLDHVKSCSGEFSSTGHVIDITHECKFNNSSGNLTWKYDYFRPVTNAVTVQCNKEQKDDFDCSVFEFEFVIPSILNELVSEQEWRLDILQVDRCPPSILTCFNYMLGNNTMGIDTLALNYLSGVWLSQKLDLFHDVWNLELYLNDGDPLPIAAMRDLRSLKELSIYGRSYHITPQLFAHFNSLLKLHLVADEIPGVYSGVFYRLATLQELYIQGNDVEHTITPGVFGGLVSLRNLIIKDSKLQHIEVGTFLATPALRNITFVASLKRLPNYLLNVMQHLETVSIYHNLVELKLESQALSEISQLKVVELVNCSIRELPDALLAGSDSIKRLSLVNNLIERIPTMLLQNQTSLEHLDLSYNNISSLDEGIFNISKELEYLNLSVNTISSLPGTLFSKDVKLKILDLSYNYLDRTSLMYTRYFELSVAIMEIPAAFTSLPHLVSLNLSHNHVYDLCIGIGFTKTHCLNDEGFKSYFPNPNIVIDVTYNNIKAIELDPENATNDTNNHIGYILIDNNPIACDCRNYGLYLRLKGLRRSHEPEFRLPDYRCTSPPELADELLVQLSPDRLICHLAEYDAPCRSYVFKPDTQEAILDCAEMPPVEFDDPEKWWYQRLPVPSRMTYKLDRQPDSIEGRPIHKLNLSHAGINNLTFRLSDTLKIIDVSHNHISDIPEEFVRANITFYLSDNPLQCECALVFATYKMHRRGLITDYERVTCVGGEKLADIKTYTLCSRTRLIIGYVAWVACGTVFASMILTAVYRARHDIWDNITMHLCYSRYNDMLEERYEISLEANKVYDVFVSFAHEDVAFVTETLLPKLEKDFAQKVCLHSRDWIAGDLITDQIIQSVDNSKRTIIVLTESFLLSEWSYLEFRTAHNLSKQEGKPRVIMLLLSEDIAVDPRLSDDIKSYIGANTYLLWGDPLFWDKMKHALAKRRR